MGEQLIEKILPALEKMDWPQNPEVTEQGRQAYTVGLERLDEYDGDTKLLSAALRTFQSGNSRPYACAGVAYTLVVASREGDGRYSARGLAEAMKWLEQAQEAAPDILEINVIEALVYTYGGRYDDARLVLDYLDEMDPGNFQLLKAEVAYWQHQGEAEETVSWFNKAAEAADNVPQRLRMRAKLGDYYLEHNMFDEALAVYKEAVHFDNKNVALWHKISAAYWQQENIEEADMANQYALRLQADYAPAVKLHEAIKKKKSEGSRFGRLFG
jgi:tetratricopeptide (TPR) repeat protein